MNAWNFNDIWNSHTNDYPTFYPSGTPVDGTTFNTYENCGEVGVAVPVITGLDHLDGMTVAILANGFVLDRQVVSGGQITLPANYSKVHVGLPYWPELETLNIERQDNQGTIQGKKVKIGNVVFRFVDTVGGWIGPDENTLYEAFDKIELQNLDGWDTDKNCFTGDIRKSLGAGYEDGGRVFYRQVDPLPVNITAVIPEAMVGGSSGV
jgi:hypothetical protein